MDYLADEDEDRMLQAAYAYVPIDPRLEHANDRKIDSLWNDGYIVRSKVGTVAGTSYKCDFDIEMTLDIVRTSFDLKPDIVVIVSGDSDFVPVVLDLREKGIRVEVASFGYSMSNMLMRRCSGHISLDEFCDDDESEAPCEPEEYPENEDDAADSPDTEDEGSPDGPFLTTIRTN